MERGAVYSQNPKAGSQVKKGRVINLTINAMNPKLVSMPNLVGYSMRQAKAELNARGLALGKLFYVDDIATNNVIRQIYHNRQIKPGKKIESGSEIDLEVGLNPDNNMTYIPDLMNKKYMRAVDEVHESSLNIGRLIFDSSVKDYTDTLDAQVYKQVPAKSDEAVLMGTEVTLYLSIDPNKVVLKENKAE
jgi:beta-lactam-binding protein with PASTA domain